MFLIRPFAAGDVLPVSSIVRESLAEVYPTSLYLDIHRWWRGGFLIAEWDGVVAGFLAAVVNGTQGARILMLAVTPRLRSQGIGTALMNTFLRECTAASLLSVELEVRQSNVNAIRFYDRHGFSIKHDIPGFYTDGEAAWKMLRAL